MGDKKKLKVKLRGSLRASLWCSLSFLLLFVILLVILYNIDVASGLVATLFLAMGIIVAVAIQKFASEHITKDLVSFGADFAQIQKQLLREMSIPYGLIDENGEFLWMNQAFADALETTKWRLDSITDVFPLIDRDALPDGDENKKFHVKYGLKAFQVDIKRVPMTDMMESMEEIVDHGETEENNIYAVYLTDETELQVYQKKNEEEKLVAGFLYIDNYEDALNSVDEVRRSLLVALIDRKVNKYVHNYGGIAKKFEKDKFLLVFQQKDLNAMQDDRFSILDEVKDVNIGNDLFLTLSFGIGIGADSCEENFQFAHTAIDLALGRGGDQAVIKEGTEYRFYGGKIQMQEKNTRVRARVKAQAIRELIETRDQVFIMGHRISDADCIGAAVAMYRAAKFSNKRAYIVIGVVTSSVQPLIDRFCQSSDYETDLFITKERALELIRPESLLIVVDTNRPTYTECPELLQHTKNIVVLDHHRRPQDSIENAMLSYVEPYASSASEMAVEILQYYADNVKLKVLEADAIYSGIVVDTQNFINKTGIHTFEAAAYLRKFGADVTRVRKMFRDSMEDYRAKAETVRNAEVFENAFAISICPADMVDSPTIVASQAANELLDIRGMKASFVLTEYNNLIYISARAIDEVNVQIIMEKLGGGGHIGMAGAQLSDISLEDAKELVKKTVQNMIKNKEI
ncbi:MAG: DHH family phosphoesterase [Lachnospiraceae bacterium]